MSGIEIHKGQDGDVCIADGGGWCPGVYTDEDAARYAHRMGYTAMNWMWTAHRDAHEIPAPAMSREDVRAWKKAQR